METNFITKDSGQRKEFSNGFVRDIDDGKLRYDLIPLNMLERLAGLYTRGAVKYGDSNWTNARGKTAIERFKQSCWRHFTSWLKGEVDEDHAIAAVWNIFAYEWHIDRMKKEQLEFGEGETEVSRINPFGTPCNITCKGQTSPICKYFVGVDVADGNSTAVYTRMNEDGTITILNFDERKC